MILFSRIFVIASYGISVVFLPWWVSVILGVFILAIWQAYVSVLLGAVLLDVLFGSPMYVFSDFAYLYTAIFGLLAVVTLVLSRTMLE